MTRRKTSVVLVLAALVLGISSSLAASSEHSPVRFRVFCNPQFVAPGGTIYGEADVENNRPEPTGFVIWGGVFQGDELLIPIEPVPGFLYAWDEHLFPIPIDIPDDFDIGEYRIQLNVGPNQEEVWMSDGKPFQVKYPSPVRATLDVTPKVIHPWIDVYANLLLVNTSDEAQEFKIDGIVKHNETVVAELDEEWVTLEAREHLMKPIFVELPDDLLPGRYTVFVTIGTDDAGWLTTASSFEVVFPSPVGLQLFVDPQRVRPGGMAYASAIVHNWSDERVAFQMWGSVSHNDILYLEFFPVHVELDPGQERLISFPIQIVELSPLGLYRVRMAIGPELGRDWTGAEALLWVKGDGSGKPPLSE